MSAVPKKKLCWNCDGNVSRETDNCPFCGVYLHGDELAGENHWNPRYQSVKEDVIPSPIYQIHPPIEDEDTLPEEENEGSSTLLVQIIQKDILPILFLMSGSVFLLFGIVLVLFSQNGVLTLQWNGQHSMTFLLISAPLLFFGWKFLSKIDADDQE